MPQNEQEIIFQHQDQVQEEISDLINNAPGRLLYSGISMIAIVFTTVLMLCYFIKYPDIIEGIGTLTAESPPVELLSRSNGYIAKILVEEGQEVNKGDELLYISNTTNTDQISQLLQWIDNYEGIEDQRKYLESKFPKRLKLGPLQNDYSALFLNFKKLKQTLKNDIVFEQIENLTNEVEKFKELNQSLGREKKIFAKELELVRIDHDRNDALYKEGVFSITELEQAKTNLLQKERQYEGIENGIIKNNIRIEQLKLEKLKLRSGQVDGIQQYQFEIAEIIIRIQANIETWKQMYNLVSPIEGIVSLSKGVKVNQAVKGEQALAFILPNDVKRKYLSCSLPMTNIGKVEKGQKSIIKFNAYPYKEFGLVVSNVESISLLPESNGEDQQFYEVKIPLEEHIETDIGMQIPYHPDMTAIIEIITEDKSILERIFNQFIQIIKKN